MNIKKNGFFINCLLYANYNLLSIIPISVTLSKIIRKKEYIKPICIISSALIAALSISIFIILNAGNIQIWQLDIPIVAIVGRYGGIYKYLYCLIIGCAIITTALSVGYGYLQKYKDNNKKYKLQMMLLIICATISLQVGFSKLIEILYPVFGLFGIIHSFFIIQKSNN